MAEHALVGRKEKPTEAELTVALGPARPLRFTDVLAVEVGVRIEDPRGGRAPAMTPYGLALIAYAGGQTEAQLTIRRDDGVAVSLPAGYYFRNESQFSSIEAAALKRCRGHVLDVGAGTGIHSLVLQSRGLTVTSIDICSQAVEVMVQRGVREARVADVFEYEGGSFDTLLLLGHGIGIVEDLDGLGRFLGHARSLIRSDGQILLDSMDVSRSRAPENLAYHDANRRSGRYVGEIRMQLEFEGTQGPLCGWLHVDPQTLADHARRAGWTSEIVLEQDSGEHLARLTRSLAV